MAFELEAGEAPDDPRAWVYAFRGGELLTAGAAGETALPPRLGELRGTALAQAGGHLLGRLDGTPVLALRLPAEAQAPPGWELTGLRGLWDVLPDEHFVLAGRAFQILEWERTHHFCGVCGTATEHMRSEHGMRCPACGHTAYPRLTPAVIVRVEKGDELLLAQGVRFPPGGFYSVLAGFVEPGESLEDTVHRELREEVGIEVTDLRYFGSQSWPFPHSLMIGFICHWAGGELRPDPTELHDAGWFRWDALPKLPGRLSIARRLIDDFVTERAGR
jgi:NAD+ diphosphatase